MPPAGNTQSVQWGPSSPSSPQIPGVNMGLRLTFKKALWATQGDKKQDFSLSHKKSYNKDQEQLWKDVVHLWRQNISPAWKARVNSWISHTFIEHLVIFIQAIYKNTYVKTFLQIQHNLSSTHSCGGCNDMYVHMSTKGLKTPPCKVSAQKILTS